MIWTINKTLLLLMLITVTRCMPTADRDSGGRTADGSAGQRSEELMEDRDGEHDRSAEQSQLVDEVKDDEEEQSRSADDVTQEDKEIADDVTHKRKESNQSANNDRQDDKEDSQSSDKTKHRNEGSSQSLHEAGHLGKELSQSAEASKNQNKQPSQSLDEVKHRNKAQQTGELDDENTDANPDDTMKEDKESVEMMTHQNEESVPPRNKNEPEAKGTSQKAKANNLSSSATGKGKAPLMEEDRTLTLNQKLEKYVALYKLTDEMESNGDINEKDVLRILSSIASSHDLTEEELAELICAILCGLGTCPPSCPGYYEPPWGPSDNLTRIDNEDH